MTRSLDCSLDIYGLSCQVRAHFKNLWAGT